MPLSFEQSPGSILFKRLLAGVVAVCGSLVPFIPEHTVVAKVCVVVVGFGAALGITSQGVKPK